MYETYYLSLDSLCAGPDLRVVVVDRWPVGFALKQTTLIGYVMCCLYSQSNIDDSTLVFPKLPLICFTFSLIAFLDAMFTILKQSTNHVG